MKQIKTKSNIKKYKSKTVEVALMSNSTAPKHKTKPTSKVPTSNFQHLTSATGITLVALVITIALNC